VGGVGSPVFKKYAGRVGSGRGISGSGRVGSGRVGSKKLEPCPTLWHSKFGTRCTKIIPINPLLIDCVATSIRVT